MKDEDLLAERVGQLEEENKTLKIKVNNLTDRLEREKWRRWFTNIPTGLSIALVILLAGTSIVYFMYKWISTPDVATYCTVAKSDNSKDLHLYGIVPWGSDFDHGAVSSIEEGVKKAQALSCPLHPPAERQ